MPTKGSAASSVVMFFFAELYVRLAVERTGESQSASLVPTPSRHSLEDLHKPEEKQILPLADTISEIGAVRAFLSYILFSFDRDNSR